MGRYWNTATGREGKFGFACQSSTDAEDFFGMVASRITYESGNTQLIANKLRKIYEKAGIPKEERIYRLCNGGSKAEYEDVYNRYHKYFYKKDKDGRYWNGEETESEVFEEASLYSARLWLGLVILTDIKEDGYCELDAEL